LADDPADAPTTEPVAESSVPPVESATVGDVTTAGEKPAESGGEVAPDAAQPTLAAEEVVPPDEAQPVTGNEPAQSQAGLEPPAGGRKRKESSVDPPSLVDLLAESASVPEPEEPTPALEAVEPVPETESVEESSI
jgi:hypothetical protein